MRGLNHSTKHRPSLTNAQRLQICTHHEKNPRLSLAALSSWASREFQLKHPLGIQALAKTLRRAPELKALDRNDLYLMRIRKIKLPKMDFALGIWATQYSRRCGRAPKLSDLREQVSIFKRISGTKTRLYSSLDFTTFLRRYGLFGPVADWNVRGTVKPILEKAGDRRLSDNEILKLAGIGKDAAADNGSDSDDDLATDNEDDEIDSDFDSDYSLSKNDDKIDSNNEKHADDEKSQAVSTISAIAPQPSPQLSQPPQPPKASDAPAVLKAPEALAALATPKAPEAPTAPQAPQPKAQSRHEVPWSEKDVITIVDDSDADEYMDQDEDCAKSAEHGKSDELVLSATATESASIKSASGYRSLVVVLDLLDQYMATQELVHMVLEDMKEKKEQEFMKNTINSKAPSAPLSSGDEGSLEETLSSITTVMETLDESRPMERATRLILRHMHYHLTCTASS
ncbi:hypothetical protein BGZ68_007606 [Mortierella alpina]|nr:hypothetical protein BGZ68_007606 [Mortierella alpina]